MGNPGWKTAGCALKVLCAGLPILIAASASAHGPGSNAGAAVDRSAARQIDRWSRHIEEASARFGIPKGWIRRVMQAESGGRTTFHGRPITSSAGAMGLMQLMPGTWAELRETHRLGPDPHDPRDNILAGAAYLRMMYERFGYPGLFAAYNAGPSRYADHLVTGRPLPAETIAYAATVGRGSAQGPAVPSHSASVGREAGVSGLFVALVGNERATAGAGPSAPPVSVFAPLSPASPASP